MRLVKTPFVGALLIAFAFSPHASAQVVPILPDEPPATRFVLPNGLTVILVEDHRSAIVGLELRYRTGSRDDPPGRAGLAGLVQRLMVRATMHVGDGEYDRLLQTSASFGSTRTTRPDYSLFNVTVPSGQLALPLWLWSDQMGFFSARIDEAIVDQEIAVIRDEKARAQNAPSGRVPGLIAAELYPANHPYRDATWRDVHLDGVTVTEIRAFVQTHYTPDRAILAIVGDIQTARAEQLVRQYFQSIPASRSPPRATPAAADLSKDVRLRVATRGGPPSVTIVWPTPSVFAYGDAQLDVLAGLLAGPRIGWLYNWLVDDLRVAAGVTVYETSRELGSEFVIHATGTMGHTADELLTGIDQLLHYMQSQQLDEGAMRAVIASLARERSFGLERVARRAATYVECEVHGIREGCLRRWVSWYGGVSDRELSKILLYELPMAKRVVVETTPASDAPIEGDLRGRQEQSP